MDEQTQISAEKLLLSSLVKLNEEVQNKQNLIVNTLEQVQEQVKVLQTQKTLGLVQLAFLSHEIAKLERLHNENL